MVGVLEIKIYSVMTTEQIVGTLLIIFGFWFAYEIYRAPMVDENNRIIKPGKKLSDLWRKRR
jgi:hypothetical protein